MGPGQAGIEAPFNKKTKKALEDDMEMEDDDDDDDGKGISIAERLEQLTKALEEDAGEERGDDDHEDEDAIAAAARSFKPKKATTESLKEFLTQALQSEDDHLLELALSVRDVKVISQTIQEIEQSLIITLLGKLTTRLATTPLRAESLAVWISHCLKNGQFQVHHLASLRNLLNDRIESFSDLLRLEGRLSMMCE